VEAQAPKRPNVIFILADDLGYGDLGCYGQKHIQTPHIDQLAAEGMRFTQYYAGTAVCAPSRCILLTGLHSGHAFVRDNRELKSEGQLALPAGTFTLAKLLKDARYRTACVGKWGLGGPGSTGEPNKMGFETKNAAAEHQVVARLAEIMRNQRTESAEFPLRNVPEERP
jgi:arylsulfatase A-like enzyme